MNERESYLMWKAYGDRGYAVQTTYERLASSFDDFTGIVEGSTVEYVDYAREEIPWGNVFTSVIVKDRPYEDEREFRLLYWQHDLKNPTKLEPLANGIRVTVDLGMLINRVYANPQIVPDPRVLDLVRSKGLDCERNVSTGVRHRGWEFRERFEESGRGIAE